MRPILPVIALVCAFLGFPGPASAQQPAAARAPAVLNASQWREDLGFVAHELRSRHANLYHQVSKADFDAAVASLDARIPHLERNRIIVEMMRIVAMVGDGHTRIDPRKDDAFGFPSLPLKLYWFDDGMYVRAAKPEYRNLVGAKVEAIGGIPIDESIRRSAALVSKETISGERLMVPLYLAMPDILEALGLSGSRNSAKLTLARGKKRWTVEVLAAEIAPKWPADTDISLITPDGWVDARNAAQPLWLQAPLDFHRLISIPDRKAIYAQLNMVADTDSETMTAFGRRILDQARATGATSLVLDLRLNQGGYGDLRNGMVADLIRAAAPDTRLFVLVGRGSFSASQFILDDLDRLTDAIFIGEPASSRPTGYGDAFKSKMPNSGISVRTSIKYWQSGQDMRPYNPIDIAAPPTFADYVAGRDPALEAALAYRPEPSLADRLIDAAGKVGAPGAVHSAVAYADDPLHRYRDVEREFIVAEQQMLARKQGEAGLEVARWSAKRFPKNSDLAVVQALIADSLGRREEARAAVEAALAIDPSNRSAQSIRDRLDSR